MGPSAVAFTADSNVRLARELKHLHVLSVHMHCSMHAVSSLTEWPGMQRRSDGVTVPGHLTNVSTGQRACVTTWVILFLAVS